MTMPQRAVTVGDVIVFVRFVFLKQRKKETQYDGKNRTTRLATATVFLPPDFCFMTHAAVGRNYSCNGLRASAKKWHVHH